MVKVQIVTRKHSLVKDMLEVTPIYNSVSKLSYEVLRSHRILSGTERIRRLCLIRSSCVLSADHKHGWIIPT